MKFFSKPISEHSEVPLADDGHWEDLVSHWMRRETPIERKEHIGVNTCYVVSVYRHGYDDNQLYEILNLVNAQGDTVAGHETLRLLKPEPRALLGRGVSREIAARAEACGADLLVIDAELSPSQMRNLEDICGISVCDREAVILNVFLRHAKTRQAKIQVEIAHLEYLRPRIRGLGLDMDQQAGGVMRGRGPGETASELMARHLDDRLAQLRKQFSALQKAGDMQRSARASCKKIALVGYTNAGKTSLMNALTNSKLSAKDQPFETLDTTTRCLTRHGGEVLLSDTVGVIRRLPQRLLASFESTLAEITEADLLLVVIDASDRERGLHLESTDVLLQKLGAQRTPRLLVFNKIDRVPGVLQEHELEKLAGNHPFMALSCRRLNTKDLVQRLVGMVRGKRKQIKLLVPYSAAHLMNMIYAKARVLNSDASQEGMWFTLEGEPTLLQSIEAAAGEVRGE
jgi:GTP-binding protein HflX